MYYKIKDTNPKRKFGGNFQRIRKCLVFVPIRIQISESSDNQNFHPPLSSDMKRIP